MTLKDTRGYTHTLSHSVAVVESTYITSKHKYHKITPEYYCILRGDGLPKKNISIRCFGKCPQTTFIVK